MCQCITQKMSLLASVMYHKALHFFCNVPVHYKKSITDIWGALQKLEWLAHYEKSTHDEKIGTLRKYVTRYQPETRNKEPTTTNKNNVFPWSTSEYLHQRITCFRHIISQWIVMLPNVLRLMISDTITFLVFTLSFFFQHKNFIYSINTFQQRHLTLPILSKIQSAM